MCPCVRITLCALIGGITKVGTAIQGFSSGRPRGITPSDDRYIVLQARRNRRQTAGEIARHTTQAPGRPISCFTVARRLHGGASETLLYDIYMDDIVSGTPDLETAQQFQSQLKDALQSCGMNLYKWSSNSPELLNSSLSSDVEHSFSSDIDLSVKTLGISWKPFEDCFVFKVSVSAKHIYTKREVLSVIAKLYDPMGFLGPVIAKEKVFLQQL
ncbi:reverse transcriptase domain-containing protein [Trichonephila clavipes]|nr:reverse transcriptase domain-containing protein [Trichonephila clavipes]